MVATLRGTNVGRNSAIGVLSVRFSFISWGIGYVRGMGLLDPSILTFIKSTICKLVIHATLTRIGHPSNRLRGLSIDLMGTATRTRTFGLVRPRLARGRVSIFGENEGFGANGAPGDSDKNSCRATANLRTLFK